MRQSYQQLHEVFKAGMLFKLVACLGVLCTSLSAASYSPPPLKIEKSANSACCLGNMKDDFGDGSLAPHWVSVGQRGTAYESGGQLVLDLTPGSPASASTQVNLSENLCGDFDVQVDFEITAWPTTSMSKWATLAVVCETNYEFFGMERTKLVTHPCAQFPEAYNSWHNDWDMCSWNWMPTADMSGKLRITRVGTLLSSYFWNGNAWTLLRTATSINSNLEPFKVLLYTGSADGTGQLVKMDNFMVQSQAESDSDIDGVTNCNDNCTSVFNPSQSDCDFDGIGDACDFLSGDADNNSIITISDAVFLINYIFSGGAAPCPLRNGDADCNDIVTISDAVYLVNYIFAGGPAPC